MESILLDIARRKDELIGYTKVPLTPYTTNLIEAYNSHLQGRLKSLKSFGNFHHAKRWLNGYILKRRLTKFTEKANLKLPNFFH